MEQDADLMTGVTSITAFLGDDWSERKVFYALSRGHIPGFKIGIKWCARKSTLLRHFEKLEQAGNDTLATA